MVINNLKYSAQTIAPNPKEIDYWIDLTEDPNGGIIKYYNGSTWDYLNQMDDQNNLILEIKEIVDDLKNITIEKVNDLKYNLKVGDKVVGTIDIPEDKFLELVEYDEDTYILTFTFHTTEGQQIKLILLKTVPMVRLQLQKTAVYLKRLVQVNLLQLVLLTQLQKQNGIMLKVSPAHLLLALIIILQQT